MLKPTQNWQKRLTWFLGILVFGSFSWFCVWFCGTVFSGFDKLVADKTDFEYAHHLPRAYYSKTARNLLILHGAVIGYAQHHQGILPPMREPNMTFIALMPYLHHDGRWCSQNPATQTPLTSNAALSNKKMGQVSKGGRAILFYDGNPPLGYRESYYVTIKGIVGHVPVADLPTLLASTK